MRQYVIINGCAQDAKKQIRRLNGFIRSCSLDLSEGNTIIIWNRERDEDDKLQITELAPTKSVLFIYADFYDPEAVLEYLTANIREKEEALYLFSDSYSGQELALRLGIRRKGSCLSDVTGLCLDTCGVRAGKMVYSNHMVAAYVLEKSPYCISIAKGQEEALSLYEGVHDIEEADLTMGDVNEILAMEYPQESSGLEESPFVVAAGRGAKNRENIRKMEAQAQAMGAAFGVSRPAAMNAWSPMDTLVGVSGAMISPEICIAAGVSGAPAFYAGIEKSKFIVAVNSDEKAAIMKKADVAIQGDCGEVLEALAHRIASEK